MSSVLGPRGQTIRRDRRQTLTNRELTKSLQSAMKDRPRKVGKGPAAFSLCLDLDRQPFKWDTNSFYRRLGLGPDASRVDIAREGQRRTDRVSVEEHLRMTTAAKAILKKKKRPIYDAVSLGDFYADDPALDRSRTELETNGEALEDPSQWTWAVYADSCVTNEEAEAWDSSPFRSSLTLALASWGRSFDDPMIALGVTRTDPRWEQLGDFPVLFVGLDSEPSEAYTAHVVKQFIAATATIIIP